MARRVNKPFLIVLTAFVAVSIAVLLGAKYMQGRGSSAKHWKNGDEAAALKTEEGYRTASDAYRRALQYDGGNVDGWVKYGDVLHELARYDSDAIRGDVDAWEQALERNPRHVGALERVLNAYIVLTELQPLPEYYNLLRDRGRALARIQPENLRAEAYGHIGVVGAWLSGAAIPERDVEAAVASLKEIWPKQRDEVAILWTIARANLQMARSREATGNQAAGKLLRDQTFALFEEAMKDQPNNAALAFRHYQARLAALDARQLHEPSPEVLAELAAHLDRAASIVKPDHEEYVEIKVRQASLLAQQGKGEQAVKQIEDLHAERPNDQRVRLQLAQMWRVNPAHRTKALEILSLPMGDDATLKGFKAITRRLMEFQRLTDLTAVRIDLYGATPEAERPALKLAMQESYDKAVAIFSEEQQPVILKLRGRMLLLEGGNKVLEAIDVLQRAAGRYEQRRMFDRELLIQLANLYARVGESGQRRATLVKIIDRFPGDTSIRKQVIGLLLTERKNEEAARHLAILEGQAKNDPDVARIRVWIAIAQQDKVRGRELVEALPEKTSTDALIKADGYYRLGDPQAAYKLLSVHSARELAEQKPESLGATTALVRLHLVQKQKEDALKLIDSALAKDAQNANLKVLRLVATDKATPEQIQEILDQQIAASDAGPVESAIGRYVSFRQQKKPEEALEVLLTAEKENPGTPQITELLFTHHLETADPKNPATFEAAAKYLERLEKIDWDQVGGNYYRARFHVARGQEQDKAVALRAAQETTRRMPGLSRSWVILGQAQHLNRQFEAAIDSYNRALEMQVNNPDALRGLVQCHLELKNYDAARRYNDQGLPSRGAFFVEMDQAFQEYQGDPRKVAERREQEVKKDPSVRNFLTLAENYLRTAYYLDKTDAKAAGEYRLKARATLVDAVAKHPDERSLYENLADSWLDAKQPEEALKVAQQFLQREAWKDRAEPHLMFASIYRATGPAKFADAEASMLQAVERSKGQPENAAVRLQLARFYASVGNAQRAVDVLTELVKTTNDAMARQTLIELYANHGHYTAAEEHIQVALADAPKDTAIYCRLAAVRRLQGNYVGAEEAVTKALDIDPRSARAVFERGLIRAAQNNVNSALSDLSTARDLGLNTVELRLELATLHRKRGDTESAAVELERALQIYDGSIPIRIQLIELYAAQSRWPKVEQLISEAKAMPQLARNPIWLKIESGMWLAQGQNRKALEAIRQAHQLSQKLSEENPENPQDPTIIQAFLQILIADKAYDQVIALTDPLVQQRGTRPYWLHTMRGQAYKAKNNTAAMNAEVDHALSVVDTVNDDEGAPVAVNQVISLIGQESTIARLKDRANPRWQIELARLYASSKLWDQCITTLDNLVGDNYAKLAPTQQLRALNMAANLYAISSTFVPNTIDKAISSCRRYVEELERRRRPTMEQLHALNNLANLLAEHPTAPNPQAALPFSQKAYDLMHRTGQPISAIADTHGWVMVLAGRVDEGVVLLREAASAKENVPVDVYYHLGEASLRKNRPEEALGHLEKASAILKENEQKGLLVDPLLKGRIGASHDRARKLANPAAASNIR